MAAVWGADALATLTVAKGGWALVTLVGLVRPSMSAAEQRLLLELGGTLQLLDDYRDVEVDRTAGITTLATSEAVTLAELVARFDAQYPMSTAVLGRRGGRRLHAALALICATALGSRRGRANLPRSRLPMLMLVQRADDLKL
jgi:hypothetical protein